MPHIPFPSVPGVPGVPALPRSPNFPPLLRVGLGLLQGSLWRSFQAQNRWGIFAKNGKSVFDPSAMSGVVGALLSTAGIGATLSTHGVDFRAESKVSDFPVEKGSFASYNKVEMPYRAQVTLCLAGKESDRAKFLLTLENARKSTELFDVITPEVQFADCAIETYGYQRTSQSGATLLKVEISLIKIRQVSAQYTQSNKGGVGAPKDASATPHADNGKVQAQTPQVSTLKSIANKLPALQESAGNYLQGLAK